MGSHRYPKVIFWQASAVLSDEEHEQARVYGPGVVFRNAQFDSKDGALEKCDGMAGEVPDRYKDRNSKAYCPRALPYDQWLAKNTPSFIRDRKEQTEDSYVVGPGRQPVKTAHEPSGGNRPDNNGPVHSTTSTTDAAAAWTQNA